MIRCDVTSPTGARCERAKSHRGDHASGGEQWPRGARGGRTDGETASIVLSALASGSSTAEAARAAGVSRQRAHAIARAATVLPASHDQLIARLRADAAAVHLSPDEYLDKARRALAAQVRGVRMTRAEAEEEIRRAA